MGSQAMSLAVSGLRLIPSADISAMVLLCQLIEVEVTESFIRIPEISHHRSGQRIVV